MTQVVVAKDKSEHNPALNYIKTFPLFAELSPDQQVALCGLLTVGSYPANTYIFRTGETGDQLFFLCSGRVEFLAQDNVGTPLRLETLRAGGVFGEVAVFADGLRTADALVQENAFTLELPKHHIDALFSLCPNVAGTVVGGMARRLSRTTFQFAETYQSIEDTMLKSRSASDRVIDTIIPVLAHPLFIAVNVVLIGIIIVTAGVIARRSLDMVLGILGLFLSFETFIFTCLVLNGQGRDQKQLRTTVAHLEARNTHLHSHIEAISTRLGVRTDQESLADI